MRLALKMGRTDVDAMLAELSPQQLGEWMAAIDFVGLDDSWLQSGTISAAIHNSVMRAMAAFTKSRKVDKRNIARATDYIPLVGRKRDTLKIQTPDQMRATIEGTRRG